MFDAGAVFSRVGQDLHRLRDMVASQSRLSTVDWVLLCSVVGIPHVTIKHLLFGGGYRAKRRGQFLAATRRDARLQCVDHWPDIAEHVDGLIGRVCWHSDDGFVTHEILSDPRNLLGVSWLRGSPVPVPMPIGECPTAQVHGNGRSRRGKRAADPR